MTDREFLIWIHDRLVLVHKESELFDYMHRLRWIIEHIPPDQNRPNVASTNGMADLLRKLERADRLRAEGPIKRVWRSLVTRWAAAME